MKRKKDEDPHQSSLDSFANVDLPSMPDLDKLAKADKMLKQNSQDNGKEKSKSLNTFEMPSMSKNAKKTRCHQNLFFTILAINIQIHQ